MLEYIKHSYFFILNLMLYVFHYLLIQRSATNQSNIK